MDGVKLYMAVAADEYELPLCVTDKPKELAVMFGVSLQQIYDYIYHNRTNRRYKVKFIKIICDGGDC